MRAPRFTDAVLDAAIVLNAHGLNSHAGSRNAGPHREIAPDARIPAQGQLEWLVGFDASPTEHRAVRIVIFEKRARWGAQFI